MLGLHRSSLARIASATREAWARRCSSSSSRTIGSARAAQYGAMAGGRSGEEEGRRNGGVPPSYDAATGGVEDAYGEDRATEDQPITPWAVSIASGQSLLRDPRHNKGMSFTEKERDAHYLRGLLPPVVLSQELQERRLLQNVRQIEVPLQRYMFLMDLQERNERLFYKLMIDNVEELLPVVYTPTVGEACQKYGSIFRRSQGLYISLKDKGRVLEVLRNWPEKSIQVIVVTDGERILGLGDLGCQGMGIPVGKLALYTALGGVRPSGTLPITIDVGTNNEELLNDEFYIGLRQRRATGQEYAELLDEFMAAVKQNYGQKALVQFEDFANHNAFTLLEKYRGTHLVFNDDIQGTAAVVLAGLIAGLKFVGGTLADHKFLFFGAGEAGTGIAELVALEISMQSHLSPEEARKNIWLVDSKGLIVSSRKDSIQPFKKLYAHEHEPVKDLLSAVKDIKPTALIGSAGVGQSFTKEVIEAMSSINKRPIILALSNPTSKSECTAEQAYSWSEEFRPRKSKDVPLPAGVRAERCWCGHLAKVKESVDFSDKMGMRFFMCANTNASPTRDASSPPPICMWYHWIDTEQPAWALQEIKDRNRRAWASFYEAEREEKEAEERKKALAARKAEKARILKLKQQEAEERAARRHAEEQGAKRRREEQRQIYRQRAAEAEAAEKRGDTSGKFPRWTQDQ